MDDIEEISELVDDNSKFVYTSEEKDSDNSEMEGTDNLLSRGSLDILARFHL